MYVLVTNPTEQPIRLKRGRKIAKLEEAELIQEEAQDEVLITDEAYDDEANTIRTKEQYTQDIRLTDRYVRYIQERFAILPHEFREAFFNGGDAAWDSWKDYRKLWVNPPWRLSSFLVFKLLTDTPTEFVLVLRQPKKPTS